MTGTLAETRVEVPVSWWRRKWRSVSFRSGLGAAFIVGIIVSLALFILSAAVFLSLFVSSSVIQISLVNRLADQLQIGIPADEVRIEDPSGLFLDVGFWAVTESDDGAVGAPLSTGGDFDQAVLDASFDDLSLGVALELSEDFDRTGTKTIDGEQWLLIEDVVEIDDVEYVVVTGALGEYSLRSFIGDGLPFLIPVLLVVMAVAGLITSWFTRRALGSVEKMRQEVELISQESLNRRVPATGARDRIDMLAETMNDMLGRLESSTQQQQRFLADASHELRSPVAGLLAQLDVAAAYPERADTAVLIPKLQAEAQRLQLVLDDLLFLSRAEAERSLLPGEPTPVDLGRLIGAELEHQRMMHPQLTIAVEIDGDMAATVVGNERDLQRAVRNLADNASRHAETRVSITVVQDRVAEPDAIVVTVADDGAGIPAEEADKIFDRFVRLDESRARDDGGSGLGLAIVREIAIAHGGSVELVDGPLTGAAFRLRLPAVVSATG